MKFACFGYINETDWEKLPKQDQSKILEEYLNYYGQLKIKNIFLGGTGLKSVTEAIKLSIKNGNIQETTWQLNKEQIGGFFIIESENLGEAKSIVSKHRGLKIGAFEIRVVDEEITEIVGAK